MARHRWQELAKNRFGGGAPGIKGRLNKMPPVTGSPFPRQALNSAPCLFNFRENYFRKAGLRRNYPPNKAAWHPLNQSSPARTEYLSYVSIFYD